MTSFIKKHWKISSICLIIGTIIAGLTYYQTYMVPDRAELRMIIDPSEVRWTINGDNATLSVNGSLYNNGLSAGKVINYSLSMLYFLPSGDLHTVTQEYKNISLTYDIINPTIGDKDTLDFYLETTFLKNGDSFDYLVVDRSGQVVVITTTEPDQFKITATYQDGMGYQTCTQTCAFE